MWKIRRNIRPSRYLMRPCSYMAGGKGGGEKGGRARMKSMASLSPACHHTTGHHHDYYSNELQRNEPPRLVVHSLGSRLDVILHFFLLFFSLFFLQRFCSPLPFFFPSPSLPGCRFCLARFTGESQQKLKRKEKKSRERAKRSLQHPVPACRVCGPRQVLRS